MKRGGRYGGRLGAALATAALVAATVTWAQAPAPAAATAQQWVDHLRAGWQAYERRAQDPTARWDLEITHQALNSDGVVTETRVDRYRLVHLEGQPFHRHVLRNGAALSPALEASARKREAAFVRQVQHDMRAGRTPREEQGGFRFDEDLMQQFTYRLGTPHPCPPRRCQPLHFVGRRTTFPSLKPRDWVIRRLTGTMLMDVEDRALVNIHAALPEPASMGLGAFKVYELSLSYVQLRTTGGVWVPSELEYTVRARALFKRLDERKLLRWFYPQDVLEPSPPR